MGNLIMENARKWIQEMIDNPSWGRTPNKWDAINEICRLLDDNIYSHAKELDNKLFILERENKALAEEGELKCEEIERLKNELDKACELLDGYNKAIVNLCDKHPRIDKEEWRKRVKDENC